MSLNAPRITGSAALLGAALALNIATYYTGAHAMWSSVFVIVAELALAFTAVYFALGQWLTWCNLFLGLLALFHLGYYLPAKLGIIDEYTHAPITGPLAETTLLLFGAAVLSFALGCTFSRPRIVSTFAIGAPRDPTIARTVLLCGLIVSVLCIVCLMIFVMQIGGPGALLHFTYLDFFNMFTIGGTQNSRYALTFLEYYADGSLLVYFGLAAMKAPRHLFRIWSVCTLVAVASTLLFGSRGTTILLLLGWAYLRHQMVARLNLKIIGVMAATLMIVIPWIASHRNDRDYDKPVMSDVQIGILAPFVEMGLTYRCLYATVEILADGEPPLHGRSYYEAIRRLVPLSGNNDQDSFLGTAVWLARIADPADLAHNGTFGSSGIGEPYANFGYPAVVVFFALAGWGFSALEASFLSKDNMMAGAVVALVVVPMGFFVRGDITSPLRSIVWPCLLLLLLSKRAAIAHRLMRGNRVRHPNQIDARQFAE
jgi:oligosaccharide repeat unit polymerase